MFSFYFTFNNVEINTYMQCRHIETHDTVMLLKYLLPTLALAMYDTYEVKHACIVTKQNGCQTAILDSFLHIYEAKASSCQHKMNQKSVLLIR